jgi:Holliday junction resolvase RusA-like endonuclease
MIEFVVYGAPQAQGRPRASVRHGRVVMYDPTSSRDYKHIVSLTASQHRPKELIEKPVSLTVKVYRPIPASWSKAKKEKAIRGLLLPTGKPDLSNYIKGVEDAIEGVLVHNDSQIVDYGHSCKKYSDTPRIEVRLIVKDVEV